MEELAQVSKAVALTLGEQRGRTTSRVMGHGLARVTGDALAHDRATDLVHAAMLTGLAIPKARLPVAVGLGLLFLLGL